MDRHELKMLLRSRSWAFVRNSRPEALGRSMAAHAYRGKPVYYRPGSSDAEIIYKVMLAPGRQAEYWLPSGADPGVVLDIGANIGTATLYFAGRFPRARIWSIEPIHDNFTLLARNVAGYPNVTAVEVALGTRDETADMRPSDSASNFGGYSFHEEGTRDGECCRVTVKTPLTLLDELSLRHVDVIKVDTEGSEYDILHGFGPSVLSETGWVLGELHGHRTFEVLEYLSTWFDLAVHKGLQSRLCRFSGCNRDPQAHTPAPRSQNATLP